MQSTERDQPANQPANGAGPTRTNMPTYVRTWDQPGHTCGSRRATKRDQPANKTGSTCQPRWTNRRTNREKPANQQGPNGRGPTGTTMPTNRDPPADQPGPTGQPTARPTRQQSGTNRPTEHLQPRQRKPALVSPSQPRANPSRHQPTPVSTSQPQSVLDSTGAAPARSDRTQG